MSHKAQKLQFDAKRRPVEYEEGPIMNNTQAEPSHYSEGRRWSVISKAWILVEGWTDAEEIASLKADLLTQITIVSSQRAEIERLRGALEDLLSAHHHSSGDEWVDAARAALTQPTEK